MSKDKNKLTSNNEGADIRIDIDVTNIVKYVCITSVLIIAIIFVTKTISKIYKN